MTRHISVAARSIMLIIVCIAATVRLCGQPVSRLADRDTLMQRLNRALDSLSPTETVKYINVGDIEIELLGLHGCERIWSGTGNSFYPRNLRLKRHENGMISMELDSRPERSMELEYNSHLLPCYLNGMIFHNWGKPFVDSLNDYLFWDVVPPGGAPHPPSAKTPLSTQKYYMGSVPKTVGMQDSVLPTLQDGSYDNVIFEDYAGTILGKNLFRVVRPEMAFVARFNPALPGGIDSNTAKPTDWELQFKDENGPTWDQSLDSTVASIKLVARTQSYGVGTDCSFGNISPDPDSAWYGLLVTVARKDQNGIFHEETYTPRCHQAFADPAGPDVNNAALWNGYYFLAGGPLSWWCRFNIDPDGWLTFEVFGEGCSHRDTLRIRRIKDPKTPSQVCETFFPAGGEFCLDRMTGEIYYSTGDCATGERQAVSCLPFCQPVTGFRAMNNVISASVQTYGDQWAYDYAEHGDPAGHSSSYQSGEQGRWRPSSRYGYRTSVLPSDPEFGFNSRIYTKAGVFVNESGSITNAFRLYDFTDRNANDPKKWLRGDSVTRFSPSGEPVEEQDALGVYSSARFAHGQMLAKLVARNAQYETVDFESFEDGGGNTTTAAHSGHYAHLFAGGSAEPVLGPFTVTGQVKDKGLQVQFWVKKTYWGASGHPSPPISVVLDGLSTSATLDSVAKTGAWTLYRLNIDDIANTAQIGSTFTISFRNELGSSDSLWIDDIRVQPLDAQMVCYVYDLYWLRLAATFDDQHFGQFYQYNGEGRLIRTIKETERGMKTVAETHYHTPLIDRNAPLASMGVDYGGMNAAGMAGGGGGRSGGTGDGMHADAEILDFEFSPDGPRTRIFGKDPSQLPTMDDLEAAGKLIPKADLSWLGDTTLLRTDHIERLNIPGLSEAEKLGVLREVRTMDEEIARLARIREQAGSAAEKETIEQQARLLYEKRAALIREKLGLSEEKLRELEGREESGE